MCRDYDAERLAPRTALRIPSGRPLTLSNLLGPWSRSRARFLQPSTFNLQPSTFNPVRECYPCFGSAVFTNESRDERGVRGGGAVAFGILTVPESARPRRMPTTVNSTVIFRRTDWVGGESGIRKKGGCSPQTIRGGRVHVSSRQVGECRLI